MADFGTDQVLSIPKDSQAEDMVYYLHLIAAAGRYFSVTEYTAVQIVKR